MATQQATMDYLMDQLHGVAQVSSRKMFGEFCLYVAGKPVGLVCNNDLYLKPTVTGREIACAGRVPDGLPYPGAKPHLMVTADRWEDRDWLCELVLATDQALPTYVAPVKKRKSQANKKP